MSISHRHRSLDSPQYDNLVSKKRAKSLVWTHFGLPADSCGRVINENVSVCKHCMTSVSAKGGSTTNMFSHLKLYHPVQYKEATSSKIHYSTSVPKIFANVLNSDDPSSPMDSVPGPSKQASDLILENPICKKQKTMHDFQPLNSSVSNNCTLSVTKFLGTTMQPYSLVEHKSFIHMLNVLNPRYKLPGRKFFSQNAIPKLYNDTVEKIRQMIAMESNTDVSVTTDCWTSVAGMPYIAITCHFINQEWDLKSFCLSCAHFEKDHTANNLAEVMRNILSDWGLEIEELASCTTDNGANIVKAISSLNLPHIPCFGHCINIGVNRALALPQLKKATARVKKLQSTIAHSWKMKRDLAKAQEFLQMEAVSLPSACDTRWWSTLKLCSRFLDNQLPICKLLQDYPDKKFLMLEGCEISVLEDFVAATTVLKDITTTLSGEDYATASSVLPLYRKIKKTLQHSEQDGELMRKMKNDLLFPLSERYEKEPLLSILRMASFCDPRFRLNFTESPAEMKETAITHLSELYLSSDELIMSHPYSTNETTKTGLSKLLEDDDDEVSDEQLSPKRKAELEINNYLMMPKVKLETNPLTWWKVNESSFPGLKNLAKKFLGIQGTSVPSERVFSTGGNVITKQRASLLPKNAEMQVFLAQNKHII